MIFRFRNIAFGLVAGLLAGAATADDSRVIDPDEPIARVSQADWSVRWWQWAFSFERVRSPIADRTGSMCASRQSGPVWFLAGTYGTQRVERVCKVPYGKTLYFPIINYVTFRDEGSDESCNSLAHRAASLTDDASLLVLEIDGRRHQALSAHRQASRCFSMVPGQPADAVANGYYVALRPLARGRHTLNFGGILPTMMQAVTYTLQVE